MKTAEQLAQWVIDNRYPKSENNKVSDSEMYHELVESIAKLCNKPAVSKRLILENLLERMQAVYPEYYLEIIQDELDGLNGC